MKKLISVILILAAMAASAGLSAAAETDLSACSITDGIVTAVEFEDVTAPCSGTLYSFDLNAGDTVSAGELLFEMLTIPVAAPEDGTVRYFFADDGDSADDAMRTYGAVLAIEPARNLRLACTYSGAADYEDCKHMHIGDILYFKYDKEKGTGVVISTTDNAYEVEVLSGKFDSGKSLELYKDDDYAYDNRVGTGKVYKRSDVTVGAAGRIDRFFVSAGDKVKKGDILFTVFSQDAEPGTSPRIKAPCDGVAAMVPVSAGQQVWKGQVLARIYRTGKLEIVADVDELDLNGLRVGDSVSVKLDTSADRILTGTVTEISALGITRQNAAYYTVHVSVPDSSLMLGQSASVYLP